MSKADEERGFELLKIEYAACWERTTLNISLIQTTEFYAIGACAAIFAFALGSDNAGTHPELLWLCPAIAFLGWIRFESLNSGIRVLSRYIQLVEQQYPEIRFNHFRREANSWYTIKWQRRTLWLVMSCISLWFAVWPPS
jgi:hypothetical protein